MKSGAEDFSSLSGTRNTQEENTKYKAWREQRRGARQAGAVIGQTKSLAGRSYQGLGKRNLNNDDQRMNIEKTPGGALLTKEKD